MRTGRFGRAEGAASPHAAGRAPRRVLGSSLAALLLSLLPALWASGAPAAESCQARGTGDLGVVIERAAGSVKVVDTTRRAELFRVQGLGDLSHASVTFSPDERYAYVFGRDGGLSKVDLLCGRLARRVVQAGNSIGGAISQDGRLVAVSNYEPGGIKVFDAASLDPIADVPAVDGAGKPSKVVGLVDAPGQRFVFSLYEAGAIWAADMRDPKQPALQKFPDVGKLPYDGVLAPGGRYYIAGLFGEDGLALLDLWHPAAGVRRILDGYGRGEQPLPVYKMPHLQGWALIGERAFLPAVSHHEVLVADTRGWQPLGRVPVAGQPVFVLGRPDGRQAWVNFAPPDNDTVQVIDVETLKVIHTLKPGKGVLHMEFTPRGGEVWLSLRDEDKVQVYDTGSLKLLAELPADKPSGIFFTARAHRIGL